MFEPNFWNRNAEAVELSIEGNRLISQEIAHLLRGLWQRSVHFLDEAMHGLGRHEHLPPV
jgi:hypothetical protein